MPLISLQSRMLTHRSSPPSVVASSHRPPVPAAVDPVLALKAPVPQADKVHVHKMGDVMHQISLIGGPDAGHGAPAVALPARVGPEAHRLGDAGLEIAQEAQSPAA